MIIRNKKTKLELEWDGHKKPTTRREFLAKGLIGASGYILAPSIIEVLFMAEARAADSLVNCNGTPLGLPGFVTVFMSGGASLGANVIRLDKNRQPLSNYGQSGLGMFSGLNPITDLGGVKFSAKNSANYISPFLKGFRNAEATLQAMSPNLMISSKTAMSTIVVPSNDDVGTSNKHDASGMIAAAGLKGLVLSNLGNSKFKDAGIVMPPSPLLVTGNDPIGVINGALGINSGVLSDAATASAMATKFTKNNRISLLSLINKLSSSQGAKIAAPNSSSGTALNQLVQCATGKNLDLTKNGSSGVDPRADAAVGASITTIWGLNSTGTMFGLSQTQRLGFAAMVYNSINGNATTVGLDIGGHDYHGTARTDSDQMESDAGELVGTIMATGAVMGKKVFVNVATDGAQGTSPGSDVTDNFVSDSGNQDGTSYMLGFDPAGRPNMKNDAVGYQLGNVGADDRTSDPTSLVGSAEKAAVAVFANYLQFGGKFNLFEQVVGRKSADELDYLLRFA